MGKIYLIGLRGAGKSTVGRMLAARFGVNYYDQDKLFYDKYGHISKFVKENSWEEFYAKSFELLKEIDDDCAIVSTGGSVLMKDMSHCTDPEKEKFLKDNGYVIMLSPSTDLEANPRILFDRAQKRDRTIFGSHLNIDNLEEFRDEYPAKYKQYSEAANAVLYDNVSPESMLAKIIDKLNELGFAR